MADEKLPIPDHIKDSVLLGLAYLESAVYGNSEVADAMEDEYPFSDIFIGVMGAASAFIGIVADQSNLTPSETLAVFRKNLIKAPGTDN